MRHVYTFLLLTSLLGLVTISCSAPADRNILDYEQSLTHADSLAQSGGVDNTCIVRLLSDLHHKYTQVKELPEGERIRLIPAAGRKCLFQGTFGCSVLELSARFPICDIRLSDEHKHHCYLIDLSESEQRLHNNEHKRAGLGECPDEISPTDEERGEVQYSLTNLMGHDGRLCKKNEQLCTRLKEYEDRSVSRKLELMVKGSERARQPNDQVQTLTAALIDGDEVVKQLRSHPKFLMSAQWEYLQRLTDRVYKDASHRLAL